MIELKIGIVSDTHGDVGAWEKAWDYLKNTDFILHAGDVLYHGAFNPILPSYSPRKLAEVLNQLSVPLYVARGNCDSDVDQLALDYPLESPYLHLVLPGGSILVHHGHLKDENSLLELAKKTQAKLVISGHTHLYGAKMVNGVMFLNPGSPSLPKEDRPPTISLYQDGYLNIIDIDSGERLLSSELEI